MFFFNDGGELTAVTTILSNVGFVVTFIVSLMYLHREEFSFSGALLLSFAIGFLGGLTVMGVLFMIQYTPYLLAMLVFITILSGVVWLILDARSENKNIWVTIMNLRSKK